MLVEKNATLESLLPSCLPLTWVVSRAASKYNGFAVGSSRLSCKLHIPSPREAISTGETIYFLCVEADTSVCVCVHVSVEVWILAAQCMGLYIQQELGLVVTPNVVGLRMVWAERQSLGSILPLTALFCKYTQLPMLLLNRTEQLVTGYTLFLQKTDFAEKHGTS